MPVLNRLAPVLAVVLLAVIAVAATARPKPGDAEPYHARMREAVRNVPREINGWTSRDTEVPPAAQKLLKPNALLTRIYKDPATGEEVTFVLVQTRDARDMIGHYPPVCYRGSGYNLDSEKAKTWTVGSKTLSGTEYVFSYARPTGPYRMVIDNLIVLPGGDYAADMDEVRKLASDHTRHFFGAGQIQVITRHDLSEEERAKLFNMVMGANLPLLEALGSAEAE